MEQDGNSPIRIGLVEDFHGETELILRDLKDAEMNFEHQVASSEKELLELFQVFDPDVVLTPYSLKQTNAAKLLNLAREAGYDRPFILLAFDLSEDIAIDLLAEGIEDYVQRSTLKRLPVAIRKALQRYKTQLELQLSEGKIRTSERSLRNMVRNAPIAVAMFDLNMNYMMVSKTWLVHEKKTEDELIGKNHYGVVPEIPEHWKKVHQRCLKGESRESENERLIREDGSLEILRWKMNPWYTSEGKIGGAVLFIEDVTEKESTQIALKKNQALLALGQEVNKSGTYEYDLETGVTLWSDNLYNITGFDKEEPISTEKFFQHVHPEDQEDYGKAFQRFLETGEPFPFEYRFIRPDNGKTVHLKVESILLSESDDKKRVIGAVQDVSKEREISNKLQEVQNSLLRAQTIANVGSWEWVVGEKNVWWSDQMYKIYERDNGPVSVEGVRSYIHPDDKNRVEKLTKNDLGPKIVRSIAYRIVLPSGNVKHVVSVAEQVKDNEGNVVSLIGTLQDLTDRALIEEELRALSLVASETVNGVIIQDETGIIEWSNKGFTRISEYSAEDVKGRRPWAILAGDQTNMKLADITYEKIKKGKPFSTENVMYTKSGNPVWLTVAVSPIMDDNGKLIKMVTVATDISKQKELEELQRATLKRLQEEQKKLTMKND